MIAATRCFNHAERVAAARCLECTRSFCRECVTEHNGRLICTSCLRKRAPAKVQARRWRTNAALPFMALIALLGSWLVFYAAGWWLEDLTAPPPSMQVGNK